MKFIKRLYNAIFHPKYRGITYIAIGSTTGYISRNTNVEMVMYPFQYLFNHKYYDTKLDFINSLSLFPIYIKKYISDKTFFEKGEFSNQAINYCESNADFIIEKLYHYQFKDGSDGLWECEINEIETFKDKEKLDLSSKKCYANFIYLIKDDRKLYVGDYADAYGYYLKGYTQLDGNNTISVGFNEETQKWSGWSHRAIMSFGIGDKLFDEYYNCDDIETIPFSQRGFVDCVTLDDCKKAAQNFATYVS